MPEARAAAPLSKLQVLLLSLVSSRAPRQCGAGNLALILTLEDRGNTRPCEIIIVMVDRRRSCRGARRVAHRGSHAVRGFVPLNDRQALAVLVGQDGSVENRVLDLPPGVSPSMLNEAANFMSARFAGLTLRQAGDRLALEMESERSALDGAARELVERGVAIWSHDADDRPVLIVRGQAHLIDDGTAADLERVRQLLEQLEGKQEISRLLESALASSATKIFIGSENKLFSLSGSSVIAAPYRGADGRVVGVVGVIGPTRLNYARVIPMVDFTAQTLSRLMR